MAPHTQRTKQSGQNRTTAAYNLTDQSAATCMYFVFVVNTAVCIVAATMTAFWGVAIDAGKAVRMHE